jgi:8-oxo-dGTP pyrophosphatase MutT (NUDIX family)
MSIEDEARVRVLTDEVVTAGAYVMVRRRFVFAVGFPLPQRDHLGVVRLGGHREPGEGAWACAAREVAEEAGLAVQPLPPPVTCWVGPGQDAAALAPGPWPAAPGEAAPLLVAWRPDGGRRRLSATYLARGVGTPAPAAESQGLLLLRPDEVLRLARERLTLAEFLRGGGQARLRAPLPPHLFLEPRLQLTALADLLERYPELRAACSASAEDPRRRGPA